MMRNDIQEVLFSEQQLADKVAELGARISADYEDKNPLVVSVLKGSYVFMADLTRKITIPCNVDFMAVSSYGAGTKTTGEVQIIKDIGSKIDGRHLIIVEDILDSGVTLSFLMKILKARGAASIRLCTLLSKPERRKVDVPIDYLGFEIPDAFVVGYGLDYAEKYRNLPYIGILKPTVRPSGRVHERRVGNQFERENERLRPLSDHYPAAFERGQLYAERGQQESGSTVLHGCDAVRGTKG